MNKAIGLALLVGGIVLLVYGFDSKDSIASSFSQAFTGSPTNATLWMLVGGTVATVAGAVMVLKPASRA